MMPSANEPKPDRHYFQIPHDITEFTDAQIETWAKETYARMMSAKPSIVKEVPEGGGV